jgi:hypothetical protein
LVEAGCYAYLLYDFPRFAMFLIKCSIIRNQNLKGRLY